MPAEVRDRRISRFLLWRSWLLFMFLHMTSQTQDRGYSNAFTAAMIPILRHLYRGRPDADDQIREGLVRSRAYYLCEQSFSGVAFAIIVGMEEKKANGSPISGQVIGTTRTSLMGPMSGLGDTLHGSTSRQLAIALTLPFCLAGHWLGALAMFVMVNITPVLTAILGVPRGYTEGGGFILRLLKSGRLQRIAPPLGTATFFIMGGTAAQFLHLRIPHDKAQAALDGLLPGVVTLSIILIYYWILTRHVSPNVLRLATAVIGVLLGSLSLLV